MDSTGEYESPVSRQRLLHHITFESRCYVLQRLGVTVEWRSLDWVNTAICADVDEATEATCNRCPVVAECLAAAIATDDPAGWRAGLSRIDREGLWAGLNRTYGDIRDFEGMRLGLARQPQRVSRDGPDGPATRPDDDRALS